jgi:hypothetical protein
MSDDGLTPRFALWLRLKEAHERRTGRLYPFPPPPGSPFAAAVPAASDARPAQEAAALPECRHSPDFRSVVWFGTQYRFTRNQAGCLRVLWEAWAAGTPEMDGVTVTTQADVSHTRLLEVFRGKQGMHPAWGTMLVQGETKGAYRLSEHKPTGTKPVRRKTRRKTRR